MDINHSQYGYVVMVLDWGKTEPRMIDRLYPDHPSAICVKHNYQIANAKRYTSVYVREATADDVIRIHTGE